MAYSGNTGLIRLVKALRYSWQGLVAAYRHEEAFRQELILAVILIPVAIVVGDTAVEKILLTGSVLLLLLVEILNSAIEAVVDRFGSDYHDLSGRAKDMGSAAVFIALIIVIITWSLILID